MAKQSTKFEVSSFSHSRDILGGLRIEMGHVTITTPFSGMVLVYHRWAGTSYNPAVYQI